jgi:hypothetical protein
MGSQNVAAVLLVDRVDGRPPRCDLVSTMKQAMLFAVEWNADRRLRDKWQAVVAVLLPQVAGARL